MIHTVKKGDTLSAIALQHGVTVADIRKANPSIVNPNIIRLGLKLLIPEKAAAKDYAKIGKAFEKALKDVEALESVKALETLL